MQEFIFGFLIRTKNQFMDPTFILLQIYNDLLCRKIIKHHWSPSMCYNITALGVCDTEPFNTVLGELQIIPMDHNFDIFKQIS